MHPLCLLCETGWGPFSKISFPDGLALSFARRVLGRQQREKELVWSPVPVCSLGRFCRGGWGSFSDYSSPLHSTGCMWGISWRRKGQVSSQFRSRVWHRSDVSVSQWTKDIWTAALVGSRGGGSPRMLALRPMGSSYSSWLPSLYSFEFS